MQDTLATTITSRREKSELIVERRSRSISSFMLRILFDESVGAGNVGFGLIVIEVADEIFDRVLGKEPFELRVKLRRQGFVVGDDQRRPVQVRMTFAMVNVLPEPVTPSSV